MRADEPTPVELPNEFAGLGPEARVKLAVRRIRSEWGTATNALLSVGAIVVDAAYGGDGAAALAANADDNESFKRIVKSLGTLEGGPSKTALSVTRRVVAANRQLREYHFWKVAPYGHKEILIRLSEPQLMAAGAQQVVECGWTQKQTKKWVDLKRYGTPDEKVKRGIGLASTNNVLERVVAAAEAKSLDRVARDFEKLDAAGRQQFLDRLDRALVAIRRVRRRLRSNTKK